MLDTPLCAVRSKPVRLDADEYKYKYTFAHVMYAGVCYAATLVVNLLFHLSGLKVFPVYSPFPPHSSVFDLLAFPLSISAGAVSLIINLSIDHLSAEGQRRRKRRP